MKLTEENLDYQILSHGSDALLIILILMKMVIYWELITTGSVGEAVQSQLLLYTNLQMHMFEKW